MDVAFDKLLSLPPYVQTLILFALIFMIWQAVASALHPLLYSIKVERSNLVIRLFHIVPVYDCYLRNIGSLRTGGVFTRPWTAHAYRYGIWPFAWLEITLKKPDRGRILLLVPDPQRLRQAIERFTQT